MTPANRTAYLLLAGLLAAPGAAQTGALPASDTRQPSRLIAYLYGREQIAALYAAGREWDSRLGLQQGCKGAYNIQPLNLFLLEPVDYPESKAHPVAGSWQHRYVFERCGKRMTYNAAFAARPDGSPEVRPIVPGDTNVSAALLAKALEEALPAALSRLARLSRGCRKAELIDTRLVRPPQADRLGSRWTESWTFRGCGRDIELPLAFEPDGRGGVRHRIRPAVERQQPVHR